MNDANVLQSMSFFAGHGSKVNKVMKSYSQVILDNPITIDNVINKCTEEYNVPLERYLKVLNPFSGYIISTTFCKYTLSH